RRRRAVVRRRVRILHEELRNDRQRIGELLCELGGTPFGLLVLREGRRGGKRRQRREERDRQRPEARNGPTNAARARREQADLAAHVRRSTKCRDARRAMLT